MIRPAARAGLHPARVARVSLAAQMLMTQEAERRRVSREMHDDLAQRVALLQFDVEAMKQRFTAFPQVLTELESLRGGVALLADDLHRICERLHPAVLENLGLVRGIAALCEDHERLGAMKVTFTHRSIPDNLPPQVSLCLYRTVQESLHNAAKYSGTAEVFVTLRGDGDGIRAVVRDVGRGFDMRSHSGSGLGLRFLAERVNLLNGRCSITSAPGKGTRISAWVSHSDLEQ